MCNRRIFGSNHYNNKTLCRREILSLTWTDRRDRSCPGWNSATPGYIFCGWCGSSWVGGGCRDSQGSDRPGRVYRPPRLHLHLRRLPGSHGSPGSDLGWWSYRWFQGWTWTVWVQPPRWSPSQTSRLKCLGNSSPVGAAGSAGPRCTAGNEPSASPGPFVVYQWGRCRWYHQGGLAEREGRGRDWREESHSAGVWRVAGAGGEAAVPSTVQVTGAGSTAGTGVGAWTGTDPDGSVGICVQGRAVGQDEELEGRSASPDWTWGQPVDGDKRLDRFRLN